MKTDINGCSTCPVGQEQYEYYTYYNRMQRRDIEMVQYDYRHTDGELFSCCAPSLDEARAGRDRWLADKQS